MRMRTLATGRARPGRRSRAGFTLVELMMTVAIIAMAGAAVVMVAPDPRPAVSAEAERYAARLMSARDEAVLTNRPIAVATTTSGYGFQSFDGREWTRLQEGPFKSVSWETGTIAEPGQNTLRIVFDPTGVAEPYRLTLRREGRQRVVIVDGAGEVSIDD